jgi:Zn-dependent M28 family amino/carboxypeptidase
MTVLPSLLAAALSVAVPTPPATDAPQQPELLAIARAVSAEEQKTFLTQLVGFGTRHTLSDTTSPTRGIGAARRFVKARFEAYSKACGGCLEIATPEETVTGARIPTPAVIQDVLAIQKGTTDPDRVVIIAGHIDSRVSDPLNATADAPGANDDGSGVTAVMEAARVLSKYRFNATIVYAVLSGEEQGLFGGKVLAHYAAAHGWKVEADLNNDIIGNTHGQGGETEAGFVRVFSEGTKAVETPADAAKRRYNGGELDSPSRNIDRYMAGLAAQYLDGFKVRMVYRTDRFGRGGDQTPLLEAGYPAVRVTEAAENYTRQHQDLRTENGIAYGDVLSGVDFPYLANVTRLDAITLASLAWAPSPPEGVKIDGAVTADTRLSWKPSEGAAGYRVWWRETTEPFWTHSRDAGPATDIKLERVVIDDWFFGVQAISRNGYASPVVFPGPAGSFISPPQMTEVVVKSDDRRPVQPKK